MKVTRPLERIHSDVSGPGNNITSIGGNKYIVTFIDDITNYVWAYPIKHKSDVKNVFKEWKTEVENEHQHRIKYFRSDNGGEYMDNQLQSIFKQSGIIHERTAAHTPEQNGKAERMNYTIYNLVRSCLLYENIDEQLWTHCVDYVVYTLNRTTGTKTPNCTPYELLYNDKPDISNLRVFGCLAFRHRFYQHSKIEPRATECQFVGYTRNDRMYKLRNLQTGKVFVSGHVTFDENIFPSVVQTNNI